MFKTNICSADWTPIYAAHTATVGMPSMQQSPAYLQLTFHTKDITKNLNTLYSQKN